MSTQPTDSNGYVADGEIPAADVARNWVEFRESGLLWLLNTSVLHPRGYALAVSEDGWTLLGDGTEQWQFACDDETQAMIRERFEAINTLLP